MDMSLTLGPKESNGAGRPDNAANTAGMKEFSGKRNKRTVWTVAFQPQPTPDAHFATFSEELIKPCILAGCPVGGTVLDPFFGLRHDRIGKARLNGCKTIGIELNPAYIAIARKKPSQEVFSFE